MKLDPEEKEILESFERGEWYSILDREKLERYQKYARQTLRKTKINLYLSEKDLLALKQIAQKKGISYQELLENLIHRYVEEVLSQS